MKSSAESGRVSLGEAQGKKDRGSVFNVMVMMGSPRDNNTLSQDYVET